MPNTSTPPPIAGLSQLAPRYRYLLCDVWGVVHNGAEAIPEAGMALRHFREGGGRVLLITNAPRVKEEVIEQLDRFGVHRAAYDDVITSGEATRAFLAQRPSEKIYYIGPDRDRHIYEGLAVTDTDIGAATMIVCTGLFDDNTETPEDYDDRLRAWAERQLPMVCANPDIIVERGDLLLWCAGALAERYRALGGPTIIFGKPHPPVYATALARIAEVAGAPVAQESILAIGDGVETDIRGANQAKLDVLFVTGGIHAEMFGARHSPDADSIHALLAKAGLGARGFIPRLVW